MQRELASSKVRYIYEGHTEKEEALIVVVNAIHIT